MNEIKNEVLKWDCFESLFSSCVLLRNLTKLQKNIEELKKEVREEIKHAEESGEAIERCMSCYVMDELNRMIEDLFIECED